MSSAISRAKALAKARIEREAKREKLPLNTICFPKQRSFVKDRSRYKGGLCSRRAGKTEGAAIDLFKAAEETPGAPVLYFTLTRLMAKRNMWGKLLELNSRYGLGYDINESDLVLKKNGKGIVYLTGVDTKGEIEKMRGVGWKKAVGDEAQAMPHYLKNIVEEVLAPSFMDYDGTLTLIGTPSPVPTGYFYDACQSERWSIHKWTVFDNPFIPNPRKQLDELLDLTRYHESDAKIQREWYGRWAYDPSSLVFRYDPAKNDYMDLPLVERWQYVIGIDIGFKDSDAIAVLGWTPNDNRVWLMEEHIRAKQDVTDLAKMIGSVWSKLGRDNVSAMVIDTGGLGKKISEELSGRYGLPLQTAEKRDKQSHIELLNDAMRTGRLMAKRDSRFAHDCALVEWDFDSLTPEKRVVSDKFHSDICFTAGTLIATETGEMPVEQVTAGVWVWTRWGLRPVVRVGTREAEVARAEFSDGRELVGTPDHPVWSQTRGWVDLAQLSRCDVHVTFDTCASSTGAARRSSPEGGVAATSEISPHSSGSGGRGASGWHKRLREDGTHLQRGGRGTARMLDGWLVRFLGWMRGARSAARASRPSTVIGKCAVVRVTPAGTAPVFALSVAGDHEYFANGVLVKNCDAVLYAFRESYAWVEKKLITPPAGDSREAFEAWMRKDLERTSQAMEQMKQRKEEMRSVLGADIGLDDFGLEE